MSELKIMRLKDVLKSTGLSKATIYAWMRSGTFPQCVRLGPNCVGWLQNDVADWIASRPTARPGS
jgi:prophage regulatory protein